MMILYGASGHAKVIIESLKKLNKKVEFLIDDNVSIKSLCGLKVVNEHVSEKGDDYELIISIGDNSFRKSIANQYNQIFGNVIHPNAIIALDSEIKDGTVVFANAVIQSSTQIGKHVIVNTKASVDHDCIVNDFVHIAPGSTICGGVTIGEGTLIGAGAIVLPNVKIGKWSVIGAGAIVTDNIGDNETWVGNPAKRIK